MQLEIGRGDQRATIVEVGGGIREYEVGGRPVLEPYPVDAVCDGAHGAPLIPWPNRLGNGRYRFDGADHQVAIDEPERDNAIHGLLRWRPWRVLAQTPDRVTMGVRLFPMPGYPFTLDVEIDYILDDEGLRVVTTASNAGDQACPYGAGQHPYLSPGSGLIDDCLVQLDAVTRITTDGERQLPNGTEAVPGTIYDLRTPELLGRRELDAAYTDLARDADGRAWARLVGVDGRTAELWADPCYPYLQVFTGDTLAPDRRRRGLAAEPMTCPSDALRSGHDVQRIEPGRSVTSTWGARLS
jgi:aldose 1-epimerase